MPVTVPAGGPELPGNLVLYSKTLSVTGGAGLGCLSRRGKTIRCGTQEHPQLALELSCDDRLAVPDVRFSPKLLLLSSKQRAENVFTRGMRTGTGGSSCPTCHNDSIIVTNRKRQRWVERPGATILLQEAFLGGGKLNLQDTKVLCKKLTEAQGIRTSSGSFSRFCGKAELHTDWDCEAAETGHVHMERKQAALDRTHLLNSGTF